MLLVFILSFFYLITIAAIYFSKEKIENVDNRIYKVIISVNIVGLLLDGVQYIAISHEFPEIFITILNKMFLAYIILWTHLFTRYVLSIGNITNNRMVDFLRLLNKVFMIAFIAIALVLDVHYESTNGIYSYGPAVNFIYFAGSTYMGLMIFALINNYRLIDSKDKKKFIPLFIFVGLGAVEASVQVMHPELVLLSPLETFVTVLTYFFIENPDVQLLDAMETAKTAAEKANRAKSDFLSSMSHEIRTPLNAIVGLSEDIGTFKDQVPPQVKEDSEDIINASQTLLEIVGNILDISKIESDKMVITEVPYDFKKEAETLAKINAVRIGEKPINFKYHIADDIPYELLGDKTHIKQVINNLLSNAIKYTNEGSVNFTVNCINQNGECDLVITVQDTGIGIKAEMINKLFTKFERLDVERNTTVEGTGLGLAITKKLVEMMGGKINVQSQYGKGSLFMVTIPQKISKMTGPEANEDSSTGGFERTMSIPKINPEQYTQPVIAEPPKVEGVPTVGAYGAKRILLADDNKLNIKVAKRALSDFNFEIEEVYDGEQVLQKFKEGKTYDLILMDIMMPNMSGEEAFKKLKEDPNFNIPTIALTADAIAGALEHYKEVGFNDYLAKPFNREQIKEKLDILFK